MTKLQKGDKAPDFSGFDQDNKFHQLEDYAGKKLVVFFYPKADTPGCTAEACDLRDNFERFQANNYALLGVSADSAKAQVDIAQRQFDNNQALVNQGFISQTALLNSQASLNGAKATHAAALATLDLADKSLADATLRSPLTGVVAQRLAQPGERVAIEARLIEVINLSQMEIEAALTAEDASRVRVGMTAQLQVEGVAQPVPAKVLRINPSAQMGSRSVVVYLGVQGREGLRQGLFAQGSLGTQSLQVLAVPVSSVRTDKPQLYVQVVQEGKVAHITVRTGERSEGERQNLVAVTGVSEGQQVLSGSVGALREGVQVKFTATAKSDLAPTAAQATPSSATK